VPRPRRARDFVAEDEARISKANLLVVVLGMPRADTGDGGLPRQLDEVEGSERRPEPPIRR
jgi:hypothetical protein